MSQEPFSPHFGYDEMHFTRTGLPNLSTAEQDAELKRLCNEILEPAREILGLLHVTSGFRSEAVNKACHGASNSQHKLGRAADVVPNMQISAAFRIVKESTIPFDQLIWEPTWLHLSIAAEGVTPRREALKAIPTVQGMTYVPA